MNREIKTKKVGRQKEAYLSGQALITKNENHGLLKTGYGYVKINIQK